MGIGLFSSCSYESNTVVKNNNPDPKNFKILESGFAGNFTIIKVKYPDCKNFEGEKILVYEGLILKELHRLKEIDPHFCDGDHLSPIARFRPTQEGLKLAFNLARSSRNVSTTST